MPKEGSHFIYLSVILIDSVIKKGKNFFPQVFKKNRNTFSKKKRYINIDTFFF